MSESQQALPPKAKRERSPSFPFISLKVAVGRLTAFEDYFKRHPAPANKAGLAWSMKGESSQSAQTLAALKAFGFVEYSGSGDSLQASVTEEGRSFLRAQQESTKISILKRAALRPKSIAKYWQMWNADRPPDPVCLDELILRGAFTDGAAKLFLSVYDETIAFARLSDSDKESVPVDELEAEPAIGEAMQPNFEAALPRTPAVPPAQQAHSLPTAKPRIVMNGDRLDIQASVDLDGLKQLQAMLKKYEEILEIMS
ncbi:MAG: hypothetical protein WAN05_25310 [Roseiarcus sp.]